MGIITGVLFTTNMISSLNVPIWVIFAAHAAIGLGTLSGGWRIVRTMGGRLTRLKPRGGFAAETAAAISILFSSELGMPVSTTHVIAGAIAGVGSIQTDEGRSLGLGDDYRLGVGADNSGGGAGGRTFPALVLKIFTPAI